MRVGGVRRVAVRPERGWKKQDPKCATEIDMGVMSGVPGAALAKARRSLFSRDFVFWRRCVTLCCFARLFCLACGRPVVVVVRICDAYCS